MTIQEAVNERLDRFDNLWLKATGHTFREDPDWCKGKQEEEMAVWVPKVDKRLEELGYTELSEYRVKRWSNDESFQKDEELEELLKNKPSYTSLYEYETFCIDQAVNIIEFIQSKTDDIKEWWKENAVGKGCFDFVKNLKDQGFEKWNDGHSGNSANTSLLFANCLIYNPELFKYMNGALACLVGDEGYHDDRSDIPKRKEE